MTDHAIILLKGECDDLRENLTHLSRTSASAMTWLGDVISIAEQIASIEAALDILTREACRQPGEFIEVKP